MTKPIIDQDLLNEFTWADKGDSHDGYTVVRACVQVSKGRWMARTQTIIKREADGTYWSIGREEPLTESSGDYEDAEITCQVWPQEVTITTYTYKEPASV